MLYIQFFSIIASIYSFDAYAMFEDERPDSRIIIQVTSESNPEEIIERVACYQSPWILSIDGRSVTS